MKTFKIIGRDSQGRILAITVVQATDFEAAQKAALRLPGRQYWKLQRAVHLDVEQMPE